MASPLGSDRTGQTHQPDRIPSVRKPTKYVLVQTRFTALLPPCTQATNRVQSSVFARGNYLRLELLNRCKNIHDQRCIDWHAGHTAGVLGIGSGLSKTAMCGLRLMIVARLCVCWFCFSRHCLSTRHETSLFMLSFPLSTTARTHGLFGPDMPRCITE